MFNPGIIEEILDITIPQKPDEFQKLICATKWMRLLIVDYARVT